MFNRQRILLVIDSMEVGGSQRQIGKLIRGLDEQQWEPELAFFREDSFLAEAIRAAGYAVHYLPKRRRWDLRFLIAYARLLRSRRYSLVHAYSLTAELWTIVAGCFAAGRPVLVASERSSVRTDRPFWFWWLKRLVVASSAAVIANSQAGANSLALRTGAPKSRFTTIANAVDAPPPIPDASRRELRESLGANAHPMLGVFLGRLAPVKNLPCLVRALAEMEPARRPMILLVGDGTLKESILAEAEERGVATSLRLLGERRDVGRLLQAADFLVLPSHFEGQSNALLEAMAAGCPVIASAVGGNVELVEHDVTGLLFPDDDARALAACMDAMHDPERRRRLSRAAADKVSRNFSADALALQTEEVYRRCLEAGSHHRRAAASGVSSGAISMLGNGDGLRTKAHPTDERAG